MNLLLKSIRLIDPPSKRDAVCDVHLVDGIIMKIAPAIAPPLRCEVRDMRGMICAPGFFDMHVHFREPGDGEAEDDRLRRRVRRRERVHGRAHDAEYGASDRFRVGRARRARARPGGLVDVHTSGCISKERRGALLAPMGAMADAGARAFTDDGAAVMSSGLMRRAFEYASMFDVPVIQHAEDRTLTAGGCMHEGALSARMGMTGMPSVAEDIIVARDLLLGGYVGGARYHVAHISTAGAVGLVRSAKRSGLSVTAEVTPHHFTLTDAAATSLDPNARMNPPLRGKEDVQAMLEGLRDGTIDCIATDHAPHPPHAKDVEFACAPFGIIGLETAIGLAITQLIRKKVLTWPQLIEKFSVNPRRILKLDPIVIKAGRPANLTLIDPTTEWIVGETHLRSKSCNTPFYGMKLRGKAAGVINNGLAMFV